MKFVAALILTLSTASAFAGDGMTCTQPKRTLTVSAWSAQQLPIATLVYSEPKMEQVGNHLQIHNVKKTISAECQTIPQTDEAAFTCELLSDDGTKGFHILLADIGDGTFAVSLTPWGIMEGNAEPQTLQCEPLK